MLKEQLPIRHYILGVFWSVRETTSQIFKENLTYIQNKGKYEEGVEYDCINENFKRF